MPATSLALPREPVHSSGAPRCSWGVAGVCIPLSSSGESNSDMALAWGGLGWLRARHDQDWTRRACSEALFLLQQLFPGSGFRYHLDARVTCPVGTVGNLGVDKSSDFLRDKQLTHSGDRTCALLSQLQDLLPGTQCIDVRSG